MWGKIDRTWLLIADGNVGWEWVRNMTGAQGFCLFPVTEGCAVPSPRWRRWGEGRRQVQERNQQFMSTFDKSEILTSTNEDSKWSRKVTMYVNSEGQFHAVVMNLKSPTLPFYCKSSKQYLLWGKEREREELTKMPRMEAEEQHLMVFRYSSLILLSYKYFRSIKCYQGQNHPLFSNNDTSRLRKKDLRCFPDFNS